MLSTRDLHLIQRHQQVESERMEKDTPCKQYPKGRSDYTNVT